MRKNKGQFRIKKLVVLFSILFLTSCAGTGIKPALLFKEIEANQTKIFVKRQTGFQGSALLIYVTLNDTSIGKLGYNEMLSASTEVGSGIVSADFNAFASMVVINDTSRQFTIEKGEKLFFVITQEGNQGTWPTFFNYRSYVNRLQIYETDQNEFFHDVRPVRSMR